MEMISNKNRKKTAKWRENRFDISGAKNLSLQRRSFGKDDSFFRNISHRKTLRSGGRRLKIRGNGWTGKLGKNGGNGENEKFKVFYPEAHIFDDKRGKQTESQSATSCLPENGAARTWQHEHPVVLVHFVGVFVGIFFPTRDLRFHNQG